MASQDTAQLAKDLIDALKVASGGSAVNWQDQRKLSRVRYSQEEKNIVRANKSIDSLSSRMFGLTRNVEALSRSQTALNKISVTSYNRVKEQSSLVSDMLRDVEENATQLSTVARDLPNALNQAVRETVSGNKIIQGIVSKHGLKTAEDFQRVSDIMSKVQDEIGSYQDTFSQHEVDLVKNHGLTTAAETKLRKDMIHAEKNLQSLGLTTGKTVDEIKHMSTTELAAHLVNVNSTNVMSKAYRNMTEDTMRLNNRIGNLAGHVSSVDKSFTALAKNEAIDKLLKKGGMSEAEISTLRNQGNSAWGMILRSLPKMITVAVGMALKVAATSFYNEAKEVAKAAAETGVGPMNMAALQLHMTAQDFQRILGAEKNAAFAGKEGVDATIANLNKYQNTFFEMTGSYKESAALILQTQKFSKAFEEGAEGVQASTDNWSKHLRNMWLKTGEAPEAVMKLTSSFMESSDVQEMLYRLNGKEQIQLKKSIQARQDEFGAVGLSTQKALDFSKAMIDARKASIPSRVEQGGKLAVLMGQLGFSQKDIMEAMRRSALGLDMTEIEEAVGERMVEAKEKYTTAKGIKGQEMQGLLAEQRVELPFSNMEGPLKDGIVSAMEYYERKKGAQLSDKGVKDLEGALKSPQLAAGQKILKWEQEWDATKGSLTAFTIDFGKSTSLFTESVTNFAKAMGSYGSHVASTPGGMGMLAIGGLAAGGSLAASALLKRRLGGAAAGTGGWFSRVFGGGGSSLPGTGGINPAPGSTLPLPGARAGQAFQALKYGSKAFGAAYGVLGTGKDLYDFAKGDRSASNSGALIGSVLGGGIGLLGGPVGVAIGAGIGNTVGEWIGGKFEKNEATQPPQPPTSQFSDSFNSMNESNNSLLSGNAETNEKLARIITLLERGTSFSEKTSIATQELNQSYGIVESEKLNQMQVAGARASFYTPMTNRSVSG